jgi:putative FmdB family regulatory protein
MPTYKYVCPECGDAEEVYHGMLVEVQVACDKCLVEKVRKPQSSSIQFKGSGWAGKGSPF